MGEKKRDGNVYGVRRGCQSKKSGGGKGELRPALAEGSFGAGETVAAKMGLIRGKGESARAGGETEFLQASSHANDFPMERMVATMTMDNAKWKG